MSKLNPVLLSQKQPELGLVCITTSDAVRFRTVTRKRLLQLTEIEQEKVLRELYADNLKRLDKALDFCYANGIKLYRMTSALFPFADIDLGETVLDSMNEELRRVGDRAIDLNIRLVFHPDQFVVLSSDKPDVVKNSIKILATHALIMDKLGQPRSPWALMNIHGGKGDRTSQLTSVIRDLPESIRSRLTFENDEYAYSSSELLDVCLDTGVAMVFDAHHHVIHEHLESYNDPNVAEMLAGARTSWPVPEWQLVHISNGKEFFADPRHSDLIVDMPNCYYDAPWIEVEAKFKELAIDKLRAEWLSANVPQFSSVS
ncbi:MULTISPECIES: UV DNA damage repair endonuclease UvsE [unclassified Microcoleus]|uniref:UV DNA damage repair endonuclease UvsE n=1 Tax=unclassified Microcoleus TaxID=2642155 RepID=UPI001E0E1F89|nr:MULTISPECIES: UV DNA damage repair endonuclease UvsE [unclassified Microcoleus]MCC3466008.1 UV DNA damage repair endonuclease UvsE [Microcoleus sp. PH2017_06_SFM_O_A]TAG75901.1 MAG: UV DNA damage repair endonuclease UvsE [Oscillatoriales cyanobacterium]MCC3410493.1 UV DNA damage repair endonuclease UvsE [Microcoleus sp. PH2017_02_FOX_O_A]MCC3515490.1 UV DNA damage repair endonuclease UvsE [Microcoleus sp. PH2017_18_LLB_O_A]MCC3586234.1 UV DNA damage repair endonuclease UvsE [Microcoleus sp.